jgi:hypothetical protein
MSARQGINSNRLTNNMLKNCGGVKKAGIPNLANYPRIVRSAIAPRVPTSVPEKCDVIKSLQKMVIRYSY